MLKLVDTRFRSKKHNGKWLFNKKLKIIKTAALKEKMVKIFINCLKADFQLSTLGIDLNFLLKLYCNFVRYRMS